MCRAIIILQFFLLAFCINGITQKKPVDNLPPVSSEDFKPTVYSIDSNASAVVLSDVGSSVFEGNQQGDFSLIFNHTKRIRLLNKTSFDEATIEIPLYISGQNAEKLTMLEATTYNMENGIVQKTVLDKASIFKDKYNEHYIVQKFTFPNIKEGSVIEYKYTISSPFYTNLQPWNFQGYLPCLWSEYQITVPSGIFDYVMMRKGYLPYAMDTTISSSKMYNILIPGNAIQSSRNVSLNSTTINAHWAMKNVAALKDEPYITTLDNYRAGIEFQLKRIKYADNISESYIDDWFQFVTKMTERENFGQQLTANNAWFSDELKAAIAGAPDNLSKAKKIYNYIKETITCNDKEGIYVSKDLKKVFQDKNGSCADINLLLVAACKKMGLNAEPAILSTRDNGKVEESYPLISQYNYVICHLKIDDVEYNLDATDKMLAFGQLPLKVYNGSARVIANPPVLVSLSTDSLRESKMTSVFIINDSDAKSITGTVNSNFGKDESKYMRSKMQKQSIEDYFKEIKKSYNMEVEMSNTEVDSLKLLENPISIKYEIKVPTNDEDIIYFNPVLQKTFSENPFKAAERFFPVEMEHCIDDIYILNMEVPKGYKVEEKPKSARVMLNENEGMFEYLIVENGNHIQLRCRTNINKANFEPEDYQTLRNFFAFIVSKENEQIVFRKQ